MMNPFVNWHAIDLNPYYGLIGVWGKDAKTFLQGQITLDIETVTKRNPGFSAYCNPKGRIRALFRIFDASLNAEEPFYLLQLPMGLLPTILETLKQYGRFSKVTLEDVSLDWQRYGFWGPNTSELPPLDLEHLEPNTFFLKLPTVDDTVLRFEWLGKKGGMCLFLNNSSLIPVSDFNPWKSLDIQANIPEIWLETTEQFLPHLLNLPALQAISFNKGCYCGQEIVARMEYRSHIESRLFNTVLSNTLKAGDTIEYEMDTEKRKGIVVTSTPFEVLGVGRDHSNRSVNVTTPSTISSE